MNGLALPSTAMQLTFTLFDLYFLSAEMLQQTFLLQLPCFFMTVSAAATSRQNESAEKMTNGSSPGWISGSAISFLISALRLWSTWYLSSLSFNLSLETCESFVKATINCGSP